MESRGGNTNERPVSRSAIPRRSCDHCRRRKISCDRGSPCSNCISARVNCAYSAIASNVTTPKQRVLISAQYEQKIDDIANGIDGIKHLLQGLNVNPDAEQSGVDSAKNALQDGPSKSLAGLRLVSAPGGEPLWDHSTHIIDFVKAVVEDTNTRNVGPEASAILESLSKIIQTLECPVPNRTLPSSGIKVSRIEVDPPMPPLKAVIEVLRWAKDHENFTRIAWISRVLPLDKFTEVCRNVYFAVDDYSEVDHIIANGYLSTIFFEYVVVSGLEEYRNYSQICRENFQGALLRLPLLLPASMQAIVALTLGTLDAIENSKAIMGWTIISAASNLCKRLGYHRQNPRENDQVLRASQKSLFWTVYTLERGLSLRLGHSSNILDVEITLSFGPDQPRPIRLARIQGKVHDQLYSPVSLCRPDGERDQIAEALAGELRGLISETHAEISDNTMQTNGIETDPMWVIYLRFDLVCQTSLLAQILRAVSTPKGSLSDASDDCVMVARDTLELHQECMVETRSCKSDPFLVTKYITWAILHTPFAPFSIIFTRSIQLLDIADLERLESFVASVKPEVDSPGSITHPYRLYELLCQVARLYIESHTASWLTESTSADNVPNILDDVGFANFGMGTGAVENESFEIDETHNYGLSNWYHGNQQIMSLLDGDLTL